MFKTALATIVLGGFLIAQAGCGPATGMKKAKGDATKAEAPKPAPDGGTASGNQVARIDPSKEKNLQSPEDDIAVTLTIKNARASGIVMHWIDTFGDRVHYKDIAAGEEAIQETFLGHYWIFLDDQDKPLGIYETPSADAVILIE